MLEGNKKVKMKIGETDIENYFPILPELIINILLSFFFDRFFFINFLCRSKWFATGTSLLHPPNTYTLTEKERKRSRYSVKSWHFSSLLTQNFYFLPFINDYEITPTYLISRQLLWMLLSQIINGEDIKTNNKRKKNHIKHFECFTNWDNFSKASSIQKDFSCFKFLILFIWTRGECQQFGCWVKTKGVV